MAADQAVRGCNPLETPIRPVNALSRFGPQREHQQRVTFPVPRQVDWFIGCLQLAEIGCEHQLLIIANQAREMIEEATNMRGAEPPAYPPSICMTQLVITLRKCEIVIFPLPSPPRRSFVLSSRLATPKSTICTEDSSDQNIATSIAPHSNFKSERKTNYLSPLLPAIQSSIKTIMWQQPPIEGRSKRIVRIHHKLVKSRQQLTQALKKHLHEGEDFYFEMRNDFYIIQVYGPRDFDVESTPRSMLGNDAKVAGIEVVNEEIRDSRLCC